MRISAKEISIIKNTVQSHLNNLDFKIYLFGSRIDDSKKGGDIDLLLVIDKESFSNIYILKNLIKFDLESNLGDQRVDLTITYPEKISKEDFLNSIFDEASMI